MMIASCDHQHETHMEAAARAGKHVYVEKPMAKRMDKLLRAYDAAKAAGVVVQVGTLTRSHPTTRGCRELYRSGILGRASRIEQCRNGEKPYWYHYLKDVRREDLDWDEFLMDVPRRPFDPGVYSGWYGYREFSDGPSPAWAAISLTCCISSQGPVSPRAAPAWAGPSPGRTSTGSPAPTTSRRCGCTREGFMVVYSTDFGNSAAAESGSPARRAP